MLIDDAIAQTLANLGMAPDGTGGDPRFAPGPNDRAESEEEITRSARQALAAQGRSMPPTIYEGSADLMRPPSADAMQSIEMGGPTEVPAAPPTGDRAQALENGGPDIPDPYVGLGQPATVAQATAQSNDQLVLAAQERQQYNDAKLAADTDRQSRLADVGQRRVDAETQVMAQAQSARAVREARADVESAGWIQEMEDHAKKEPNPGRWWENKSGLGKALWAMSLVFGSAYSAMTPGAKNAALEMIREEVRNDVASQRARLAAEASVKKLKGERMESRHARDALNARDDYTAEFTKLQALERAWMARESVPGDLDAQAAKQEGLAWLAQERVPVAERYRQEAVHKQERQDAQKHAERMAAVQRRFQAEENALNRAEDARQANMVNKAKYDLAPVDVSVSGTGAGSKRNPLDKNGDPRFIEIQSGVGGKRGLIMVGPDGKPAGGDGVMMFDRKTGKELFDKANTTVQAANSAYTSTLKIMRMLEDNGSLWDRGKQAFIGTTGPALNAEMEKLAYSIAQAQNKVVTDKDKSSGGMQALGFDANGGWLNRGKFAFSTPEIVEKLKADIGAMPEYVTDALQSTNDGAVNGQGTRPVWDPKFLDAPEAPPEKNAAEQRGEAPRSLETLNSDPSAGPVTSPQDYEKRRVTEAKDNERRGTLLPAHDSGAVRDMLAKAQGGGPAHINKIADEAVKALEAAADAAPDEATKAKLRATHNIVRNLANAEVKRAEKTIERIRERGKFTKLTFGASDDTIRSIANKAGLTDHNEVEKIIKEFRDFKPMGR
jgi:hypothetical protein